MAFETFEFLRPRGWTPKLGFSPGVRGHGTTQLRPVGSYVDSWDKIYRWRYGYAGTGGVQSEFGACSPIKTIANAVAPAQSTVIAGTGTAGSVFLTITVGATDGIAGNGVIAANSLFGGSITIGNGANQHPQNRRILGNTPVAAGGGLCTVRLDDPLGTTVLIGGSGVTATNIEALLNPWGYLTSGNVTNSAYVTFLGMPAVTASAGEYLYFQTRGPCWITSDGLTADDANDRDVYFMQNGSVKSRTEAGAAVYQKAGFVIDASGAGSSNAPFVCLQLE